tara:strand:+ start:1887 stop:2261 length:375 start_codon:yes stop_codon:yes gene_type:complete
MKDTVKISRDALEQLTDFVRKDIEVVNLETSDNQDLKYIVDVTDALMSAKYSLELYAQKANAFIEIKYLMFLTEHTQDSFDFIAPDTDWNCLSDMLATNLLANAILEARQAMQVEPEIKEELNK